MNRSSNLMQAAVVLNSLPKQQAANLLARLEPSDIKTVLDAVKRLDNVSATRMSAAMDRLAAETESWRVDTDDAGINEVQRSIANALATPRTHLEKQVESTSPFEFLIDMIPMIRVHVLEDEHPKNIAIVLSMLPPNIASATMGALDDVLRGSVMKRLCELEEVNEEEVAELSFALKLRLKKLLNSQRVQWKGVNIAASLLSCSDNDMREHMLTFLGQSDPDLANKLQRSVFKIDHLEMLENEELKTVLKHVDTSSWAPALKNASMSLQAKIFANMAPPVAKLLSGEMSEIGDVDSHIEGLAQQNIIQAVLNLASVGKIELRKNVDGNPISEIFPTIAQPQPYQVGTLDATSPIN
jgi:flagellar motor switch protein FliG